MIEKLKSLIVSEVENLEKEKYEKEDKYLQEELAKSKCEMNNVKYNYEGKNRAKVFLFDFLNHGAEKYHWILIMSTLMIFLWDIMLSFSITKIVYLMKYETIEANVILGCIIVCISCLILLSFGCLFEVISKCIPKSTKECKNMRRIIEKINENKSSFDRFRFLNENAFNRNSEAYKNYNYEKIPVSKIVLNEAINVLEEQDIKELLRLGDQKDIFYSYLIKKIKNIETEKELDEVYDNLKENNKI